MHAMLVAGLRAAHGERSQAPDAVGDRRLRHAGCDLGERAQRVGVGQHDRLDQGLAKHEPVRVGAADLEREQRWICRGERGRKRLAPLDRCVVCPELIEPRARKRARQEHQLVAAQRGILRLAVRWRAGAALGQRRGDVFIAEHAGQARVHFERELRRDGAHVVDELTIAADRSRDGAFEHGVPAIVRAGPGILWRTQQPSIARRARVSLIGAGAGRPRRVVRSGVTGVRSESQAMHSRRGANGVGLDAVVAHAEGRAFDHEVERALRRERLRIAHVEPRLMPHEQGKLLIGAGVAGGDALVRPAQLHVVDVDDSDGSVRERGGEEYTVQHCGILVGIAIAVREPGSFDRVSGGDHLDGGSRRCGRIGAVAEVDPIRAPRAPRANGEQPAVLHDEHRAVSRIDRVHVLGRAAFDRGRDESGSRPPRASERRSAADRGALRRARFPSEGSAAPPDRAHG